jgi:hypothetical protein
MKMVNRGAALSVGPLIIILVGGDDGGEDGGVVTGVVGVLNPIGERQ